MSMNRTSRFLGVLVFAVTSGVLSPAASADIYEWEYRDPLDVSQGWQQSEVLVPDGAGVTALPAADLRNLNLTKAYLVFANLTGAMLSGANLSEARILHADFNGTTPQGFTEQQLYSTQSYQEGLLVDIDFGNNNMNGWDFSGQRLDGVSFRFTSLENADFSGASMQGAILSDTTSLGFSEAQFASTSTYQSGKLSRIELKSNDLNGWDFSNKDLRGIEFDNSNLTNADMSYSNLTYTRFDNTDMTGVDFSNSTLIGVNLISSTFVGADMSGADLRMATGFTPSMLSILASYENMIEPDGAIRSGLDLGDDDVMIIRGLPQAVPVSAILPSLTVYEELSVSKGGTLRFELAYRGRGIILQPLGFDEQIDIVNLGGVLEVMLDPFQLDDLESYFGRRIPLFDWSGVAIQGEFDQIVVDPAFEQAGFELDFSQLYITGEFKVIPEPAALALYGAGGVCLLRRRGRGE